MSGAAVSTRHPFVKVVSAGAGGENQSLRLPNQPAPSLVDRSKARIWAPRMDQSSSTRRNMTSFRLPTLHSPSIEDLELTEQAK